MTKKNILISLLFIVYLGWYFFTDRPPEIMKEIDHVKTKEIAPLKTKPSFKSDGEVSNIKEQLKKHQPRGATVSTLSPPKEEATPWEGSKSFSLGSQTITLRDGDWRLHITPVLSTESPSLYRTFAPLRKRFLQMLYFLGSHRLSEGMRSSGAEERFRLDYSQRVHNVLRNVLRGETFTLEFESFVLEEVPEDETEWIAEEDLLNATGKKEGQSALTEEQRRIQRELDEAYIPGGE